MGKKPVRNPAYLRWIRSLPCSVAAPDGRSRRPTPYHRLGPSKFSEVHRLSIREIVARLSAKSRIRVESGNFVGRFGDEDEIWPLHVPN